MTQLSTTLRLYLIEAEGDLICVGMDGYAGPYFASDYFSVPVECDPVGMTPRAVGHAEAVAARARSAGFVAARKARASAN